MKESSAENLEFVGIAASVEPVAVGLSNAMIMIANTSDPTLLVRQHLEALETSAVGLALCALLFSASFAVDLIAARMRRRGTALPTPLAQEAAGETPLLALLRRSPGLIGLRPSRV